MKKTKNNGITLVALVVTIILLLILAGITISQLTESGLFENAKLAEQKSKEEQEKEQGILGDYENEIADYISNTRNESNQSKLTVLFDAETDEKGVLSVAGATDGSSERTFTDNVRDYDVIFIYLEGVGVDRLYQPSIFTKYDYDKTLYYFMGGISSTVDNACGRIKIDSINNKIIYEAKGGASHQIYRVIGEKK